MKSIIYRKNDLRCVGTVSNNMDIEQEIKLNVIPNFSGTINDYDVIETNLIHFELIRENGIVKAIEEISEPMIPELSIGEHLLDYEFRISMLELGV